jgi:hypothetical protein
MTEIEMLKLGIAVVVAAALAFTIWRVTHSK